MVRVGSLSKQRSLSEIFARSSFEVDTRDLERPVVRLEVMNDGLPAYRYAFTCACQATIAHQLSSLEILGKPVELKASSALASVVPSGFLNVLDKIGLNPTSWF